MKKRSLILIALAVLAAVPAFSANLIVNGSFEAPVLPSTASFALHLSSIPGWTVVNTGGGQGVMFMGTNYQEGLYDATPITFQAYDGTQHVDLTGNGNIGYQGVEQDVATIIGMTYRLTWAWGNMGIGNSAAYCADPACNTSVNYYASGARLGVVIWGTSATYWTNDVDGGRNVAWQTGEIVFTATSALTKIGFYNENTTGSYYDHYVGLDAVSLEAIPEPASIALVGCGLLAAGLLQRRRVRKN